MFQWRRVIYCDTELNLKRYLDKLPASNCAAGDSLDIQAWSVSPVHPCVCRTINLSTAPSVHCISVQGIHKRMVRFQTLNRNLFLTLHTHNIHRQQQQLSKFLMRYQQFASHAYWGAAGPVSKMALQQKKAFCVLRFEVSISVITVHETHAAVRFSCLLRGQFPRWRCSRKMLSVCSVLRCPYLWLQCSVSFVHGLEKTHLQVRRF